MMFLKNLSLIRKTKCGQLGSNENLAFIDIDKNRYDNT